MRRAASAISRMLSPAHRAMYHAIHTSRAELGTWPDFGRQVDREMVGLQLARTAAALFLERRNDATNQAALEIELVRSGDPVPRARTH